MHPFRAFITLYSTVTDEDWETIQPCVTYKIVQQNRILLQEGSICKHLYFLEIGSIRYFTIEGDTDNTIHSLQPPSLFTAAQSFVNQIPSEYGIQALDESYVWMMTREDAYDLTKLSSWNEFLSNYFSKS